MPSRSIPPRSRIRRPRAIDPRLVIGAVLVLLSVAGVVGVLAASDRAVAVYAAADDLTPGEPLRVDDLVVRRVVLDGAEPRYVRQGALPAAGAVVQRPLAAGELLPVAALGRADGVDAAAVVIQVTGRLGSGVAPGRPVDLWAATPRDRAESGPPEVLAAGATVVRVLDDEGLVASGSERAVEVLVPRAALAEVLQSIADEELLSIVAAGLPLER